MWIITDNKIINLDNYDSVWVDNGHTFISNAHTPGRRISEHDQIETIAEAIRRGDNYVEVN